jgi:hypothetical protein
VHDVTAVASAVNDHDGTEPFDGDTGDDVITGTDGGVRSNVNVSVAALALPAESVLVTVSVYEPSGRPVIEKVTGLAHDDWVATTEPA